MCKWILHFANESDSLWRYVISRKFEVEIGGWCSREVKGDYGVGFWKEIRKEWEIALPNVMLSIGDGRRVCF